MIVETLLATSSAATVATDDKNQERRCKQRLHDRFHRTKIMPQSLGSIALLVRDYDEAIAFFTNQLGFQLIEDTDLGNAKRWVRVRPPGSRGTDVLLARAVNTEQSSRIGNQTGGRVFLFLHTDDFWRDYHAMTAKGVKFVRPPSEESYGTVAVFEDLYGNKWDLLQLKTES